MHTVRRRACLTCALAAAGALVVGPGVALAAATSAPGSLESSFHGGVVTEQ